MSIQRSKRTTDDPLQQPSPFSASEIVKAARASLKEPTRPVTPANAGRRLLQSDGYASRPQTSGGQVTSREFLHGSGISTSMSPVNGSSNQSWRISSSSSTETAKADIWQADEAPSACIGATAAYVSTTCRTGAAGQLPFQLARQQLQPLCGPGSILPAIPTGGSSSMPVSSLHHGSPLRPSSALASTVTAYPNGTACDAAAAGTSQTTTAATATRLHSATPPQAGAQGSQGYWADQEMHQPSSDTDATSVSTVCPRHSGHSSSRDSSSGSSRGSSRGGTVADDAPGRLPCAQDEPVESGSTATAAWHHEALQAIALLNSLPVSPSASDSMALLQACAALQTVLDTAEDQQRLQEFLATPATTGTCTAAMVTQSVGSAADAATRGQGCLQGLVVTTLVRLADCPKPDVLIKVGSMLLRVLPVKGSMMVTAAKLLYRLSKDTSNDTRFRHHGAMRPLLSIISQLSAACVQSWAVGHMHLDAASRKQLHGALLYCTGCLKNVSAEAANQKALGRLGAVAMMAQVLHAQVTVVQMNVRTASALQQEQPQLHHEEAAQVCVQVTAVLRNMAILPNHTTQFVQQQGFALQALLQLLAVFAQQDEVLLNVSRCLSKLCLQGTCRACMLQLQLHQQLPRLECHKLRSSNDESAQQSNQVSAVERLVQLLLGPTSAQPNHWPLVLRTTFVLGTLTTHHPEARTAVAAVPGALMGLVQLALQLLHRQPHSQQLEGSAVQAGATAAATGKAAMSSKVPVEDMLVKLIRLLGNVAIDQVAGAELASNADTVQLITGVLHTYEFEQQDELVLNAAAALTNLSYYSEQGNQFFQLDADTLLQPLLPMLTSSSQEALIEAARAISNLARGSTVIQAALLHRVTDGNISVNQSVLKGNIQPAYKSAAARRTAPDTAVAGVAGMLTSPTASAEEAASSTRRDSSAPDTTANTVVGPYLLQALVLLLSHGSWEVVYNVAGALLNLTTITTGFAALQEVLLLHELHAVLQRLILEYGVISAEQALPTHSWRTAAAELVMQCISNLASGLQVAAGPCSTELLCDLIAVLEGLAVAHESHNCHEKFNTQLVSLVLQRLTALQHGGQ